MKDEIDISICKEFEQVKSNIIEYIDCYNNSRNKLFYIYFRYPIHFIEQIVFI